MAWANSLIPSGTIQRMLSTATISVNFGSDALKCALYNNTVVPAQDTNPAQYNVSPWGNTNEVTGTNWASGGVAVPATNSLSVYTAVGVQFQAGNISVASTTISTAAYGCIIYDSTLAGKDILAAIYFGGTGYTTSAGTFGITWQTVNSLTTIWYITLH